MKKLLLIAVVILFTQQSFARDYLCFYMLNEEIRHSVEENGRQKTLRNTQLQNLATETVNKEEWWKFKDVTEKINKRLNHVSFAIQAIPTSVKVVNEIERTYEIQRRIAEKLVDAPQWIPLALNNQIEFVDDLQMNIRFLAGIILSYGDLNKMEKAERKILLEHAVNEFSLLRQKASSTYFKIVTAEQKYAYRRSMLDQWFKRDKRIIEDILTNARNI